MGLVFGFVEVRMTRCEKHSITWGNSRVQGKVPQAEWPMSGGLLGDPQTLNTCLDTCLLHRNWRRAAGRYIATAKCDQTEGEAAYAYQTPIPFSCYTLPRFCLRTTEENRHPARS